jgi:hypothetical protein
MKLQIDTQSYKNKDLASAKIGSMKKRIQSSPSLELSLEQLADKIGKGHSFSPAVLKGGLSSNNWKEQQIFCIDVDNNLDSEPMLTIDMALAICDRNSIKPAFYYFTYSHTEVHPKYRLAFVCKEVITDESQRRIIMDCLVSLFTQSDAACKNADRIFFGTNKEVKTCESEARFKFNDLLSSFTPPESSSEKFRNPSKTKDFNFDKLKQEFDLLSYMKEKM